MIDLTPLDVRKKRGDFRRAMRGYDAEEVDVFLEVVADRLEELVKENMALRERASLLGEQVNSQEGREKAVHDALVTAQELRQEIRTQAEKEAELVRREAEAQVERVVSRARGTMQEFKASLAELERQRARFLKGFRSLLERELDGVEIEEKRTPLEEITLDIDLSGGARSLDSLFEEAQKQSGGATGATGKVEPGGSGPAAPTSGGTSGAAESEAGSDGSGAKRAKGEGAGSGADEPSRPRSASAPSGDPIVDMFGERDEALKETDDG